MKLADRQIPYVGEKYYDVVESLFNKFNEWRNRGGDKIALEEIFLLFGITGSGKSRALDELAAKFFQENVLAVPLTFNDFMGEIDNQYIKCEFVIRLLFSIFIKDKRQYQTFHDQNIKYLTPFEDVINWEILLQCLSIHFDRKKHKGVVILIDEIAKTTESKKMVNDHLYRFLVNGFNETSNGWGRNELGVVFTTLNIGEFYKLRRNWNRQIESFNLPNLTKEDIEKCVKNIGIMAQLVDNDRQLEALLRLSQGRPRLVVELLFAKKEKFSLYDTAMKFCPASNNVLLNHSLIPNKVYYDLTESIGDTTVSEYFVNGQILQPSFKIDTSTKFEVVPSLLGIFNYIRQHCHMEPVFGDITKIIYNIGVMKSGRQFEVFHYTFDLLKRNYLYQSTLAKNTFEEINGKHCVNLLFWQLYGENGYYLDYVNDDTIRDFSNDSLYFEKTEHIVEIDCDFKDYTFNLDECDIGATTYIFSDTNQGFDSLYFGYRQNGDIVAIFIENKYKAAELSATDIKNKHELICDNIKNHSFIKDFYHVFASVQKTPQQATLEMCCKENKFHNMYVLPVSVLGEFYGPTWECITSYFTPRVSIPHLLLA